MEWRKKSEEGENEERETQKLKDAVDAEQNAECGFDALGTGLPTPPKSRARYQSRLFLSHESHESQNKTTRREAGLKQLYDDRGATRKFLLLAYSCSN
jgi:hypothetical protein